MKKSREKPCRECFKQWKETKEIDLPIASALENSDVCSKHMENK